MATLGNGPLEGQSSNRPPYFNGSNYSYWKARMRIYIQSVDFELWRIVANGPFTISKTVEGTSKSKPEEEWDAQDLKKAQLNAKAIGLFYNALCENEFNRISACETAEEIWDKLEVAHEGTSQVKQTKIDQLMHKYELFKMNEDENISEMFTRFTSITNALKCLGKDFIDAELVRKVLRCLPRSWLPKVTAIQEAKDLMKMTLDELHGSLATHELILEEASDETKKKKSIALKSTSKNDSEEESDLEEELVLLMKNFNKILKKKKFGRKLSRKDQIKGESSKDNIICFGCNKPGHYVSECPKNQRTSSPPIKKFNKKPKKKAMVAETWSDDEVIDSDSNEDYRCLMAREDSDDDEVSELSYDELYDVYGELLSAFKKSVKKNSILNKRISSMDKELGILKKENEILLQENSSLKSESDVILQENDDLREEILSLERGNKNLKEKEVDSHDCNFSKPKEDELVEKIKDLENIIFRFTEGKNNFEKLLGSQKQSIEKSGLGFDPYKKLALKDSKFIKESTFSKNVTCFHCNRVGHYRSTCPLKDKNYHTSLFRPVKMIWIPKGTAAMYNIVSNIQGPKQIWVPKSKV